MRTLCAAIAASALVFFCFLNNLSGEPDDDIESNDPIDGAWRWSFTMPDGTSVRPKLILTNENGQLTGTTSFRPGTEALITNGSLVDRRITFQVVRLREGQPISTTYSGEWSGRRIEGKIQSDWTGKSETYPWEAERTHLGVEGVWTWTNSLIASRQAAAPNRPSRSLLEIPTRVSLRQEGNRVTGKTLSRYARPTSISFGSITNGEVQFEIARFSRTNEVVLKYHGVQAGETITGSVELEANGKVRKGTWEAKRVQ